MKRNIIIFAIAITILLLSSCSKKSIQPSGSNSYSSTSSDISTATSTASNTEQNCGTNTEESSAASVDSSILEKNIATFQENNLYGYMNTETGAATIADFTTAWPFIDGYGCALESDGNLVLLDLDFNNVWGAYDIIDLAPEIVQYENMSDDAFYAAYGALQQDINGQGEDNFTEYYKYMDYIENTYTPKLNAYDSVLAAEFTAQFT